MPDALLNMTVLSLSRPAAGKHPATPNALVGAPAIVPLVAALVGRRC